MMDETADLSRMKRDIYPVPDDVLNLLRERGLLDAYHARPPYQQNDYIGWIGRAKRPDTREKRIGVMLAELEAGNLYMRMKWNGGSQK